MSEAPTQRFREVLVAERDRVQRAIDYLHQENPGSLEEGTGELVSGSADNHMGDLATETFDRELDYTLEDNAETVLAEIDAALRRIDNGTYGTCQMCGRPIDPDRLEARPWATLCIDDQRRQERG
ncbi:MAG: TraR/DksA family transcriptional regulator [Actinomycetota bacterium]|nr:TraR/DksA family transcriptional regulator [Actinomycetota bacterium]